MPSNLICGYLSELEKKLYVKATTLKLKSTILLGAQIEIEYMDGLMGIFSAIWNI